MKPKRILYVNLGDNVPYTYDKISGRVLVWAKSHTVTLLVPELSRKNIKEEISSRNPKKIGIISLPFSNNPTTSPPGIIKSYFLRLLMTPVLLKSGLSFDTGVSNSAFLVDVWPVLMLRIFQRCPHWILIMDSVVPDPKKRQGNPLVNYLTYWESLFVGYLAQKYADVVFTVNPELGNIMIKRGIDKKIIRFTQNGLFVKEIHSVKKSKKQYTAVYQGRISSNKGVLDLIEVWKKVVDKIPSATLALMGTGLKENIVELKDLINKYKLQKNVFYLGFTPKPTKYQIMKSCRVFLYLSKVNADESWGISLMEALACGLPAICYDLPIYKYIYKTSSVSKVNKGNISEVAKKTIKLILNPAERQKYSLEAIHFSKKFDWSKTSENDLKILNDIMNDDEKI